jgi:hypothetical protein
MCGVSFQRYSISQTRAAKPQYCSKECLTESRKGPRTPVDQRFWRMVSVGGPDDCWEFKGHRRENGYGWFSYNGKSTNAHRIAYTLTHGEIEEAMFVCHSCDNPPCCNPRHLWLGTSADNTSDMDAKGRRRSIPQHGSKHGLSKLTEDDVISIRGSDASPTEIARAFGVTRQCVMSVINRRTWRHI